MSQNWIERNKEQFGVQIIELKKIIENQVLASGKSDEFTSDMYVALISGRKITEKMEAAIDRLIKANSPDELLKREEWVDKVVPKLLMVENMIDETSWTEDYRVNTKRFVSSIIKQAKQERHYLRNRWNLLVMYMLESKKILKKVKIKLDF